MTEDWVHGVGHSPVCKILLQIVLRAVITSSPPAWTSSAGMLSTLADFPFFNDCTAASTSLRRMGLSSSVSVWVQFSTDGSPLALWLYNSEQYSVHRFSICRSTATEMSLIRHRRRTFLLYKETGMQKRAGMHVQTGKAFVDPSDTNERGLRLLEFASSNDLVLGNTLTRLVITKHPEDGPGIAQTDNTTTRLITF